MIVKSRMAYALSVGLIVVLVGVAIACFIPTGHRRPSVQQAVSHRRIVLDPETSCGPVALSLISRYLGNPIKIAEFHQSTKAGKLGVCSISKFQNLPAASGIQ